MTGIVRLVRYGPAARAALAEGLESARRGALDPVTVVVPSALAGVTLRRALATPALAGVRFCSMPQLLRELAARAGSTAPVAAPALRRARVAAALAEHQALWPTAISTPSGRTSLESLLVELDEAAPTDDLLARLDSAPGWAPAVAAVYRSYAAAPDDAVVTGASLSDGPVVVHLPRRLSALERRVVGVLGKRGLVQVLVGITGEDDVDLPARELATSLSGALTEPPGAALLTSQVRLAPDAEEEVRGAVRDVLIHLGSGTRPDRLAITYRSSVPYARLVHEQLTAAGLPHHVPRQRTLAGSVTAGVLLGLLDLPAQDWSRQAVMDVLDAGPIRPPSGGRPSVAAWTELACAAGVTRGRKIWDLRLTQHVAGLEADDERTARSRTDAARVLELLEHLDDDLESVSAAQSWTALGTTLTTLLQHWMLPLDRWTAADTPGPPEIGVERRAYEAVLAALAGLAALDRLDPPPPLGDLEDRREAIAAELERPMSESHGLGRGVLVGPISEFVGADLDLLVVLGMAEGSFPPRLREHPLLRDAQRIDVGLATTADRRTAERRDFLAACAGAASTVLSAPVSDTRAQRPTHPSPWLLEHEAQPPAPVSFEDELLQAGVLLNGQERLVRSLLTTDRDVAGLDLVLARGLEAVDARRRGVFGPWLGGLSLPLDPQTAERLARSGSASSLQTYATCPLRWFLDKALGLQVVEEPREDDVAPMDRGTLVHKVLEEVVAPHLGRDPGAPWSVEDHQRADALLDDEATKLASLGRTGRPAVWRVRVTEMRRMIHRLLLSDDAYRAARRAAPQAVEMAFGTDGSDLPPVELDLPSGRRVSLRGSVDRVDITEGGVVLVLDYKTGKSESYGTFPMEGGKQPAIVDLSARGQHLQLPLYAVAATREHGPDQPVEAYYSFVDEGGTRRGGLVGPDEHHRLLEVLDVATRGIAGGSFPARPGAYDPYFRTFANCGFCPFDRLCSASRDDQWEGVRSDPRVSAYAELAEGEQ